MANTPRPTTARRSVLSGAGLVPHGDSHDINGVDPVLGSIRVLALVTSDTRQLVTTLSTDGINSYEDITALVATVQTRGGMLRITLGGNRSLEVNTITPVDGSYYYAQYRINVGATSLPYQAESFSITGGDSEGVYVATFASPLIWFYEVGPGSYTIQVQTCGSGVTFDSSVAIPAINGDVAYLQIEELLPLRQG